MDSRIEGGGLKTRYEGVITYRNEGVSPISVGSGSVYDEIIVQACNGSENRNGLQVLLEHCFNACGVSNQPGYDETVAFDRHKALRQ
jgi:hypothetical protein